KERIDEVRRIQPGLSHQLAQALCPAQPPHTPHWETRACLYVLYGLGGVRLVHVLPVSVRSPPFRLVASARHGSCRRGSRNSAPKAATAGIRYSSAWMIALPRSSVGRCVRLYRLKIRNPAPITKSRIVLCIGFDIFSRLASGASSATVHSIACCAPRSAADYTMPRRVRLPSASFAPFSCRPPTLGVGIAPMGLHLWDCT